MGMSGLFWLTWGPCSVLSPQLLFIFIFFLYVIYFYSWCGDFLAFLLTAILTSLFVLEEEFGCLQTPCGEVKMRDLLNLLHHYVSRGGLNSLFPCWVVSSCVRVVVRKGMTALV